MRLYTKERVGLLFGTQKVVVIMGRSYGRVTLY